MNYSELIHDFVDGNLDPAQEDKLFMMLSGNEELRNELKDFIKIEKAFSKNMVTFAPSSSATIGLMSRLGIGAVTGAAITNSPVSPTVGQGFIASHSKVIISGFVSAVATFLIFFGIYSDKIFNDNIAGGQSISGTSLQNQNEPARIYSVENNDINQNKVNLSGPKSTGITNHSSPKPAINLLANNGIGTGNDNEVSGNYTEKSDLDTEIVQTDANSNVSNDEITKTREYSDIYPANSNSYQPAIVSRPESNFQVPGQLRASDLSLFDSKIGLLVELRSAQYWQANPTEIEQSSIPLFYNGGISVLYSLNDYFKIGLDVRNEHYYQKFQGTDADGNLYEYTQYPNYTTWGIAGRWNFLSYDFMNVYSQLALGGTQTGGVGRIVLGSEFHASPTVKFIISIEGSTLAYKHQGQIYFSPKYGINYGVGLNF